jgi:membrane-associated HD superfamily phosphohydrolase
MNKRKSKHKLKKISARLTNKKFINISIKVFLVVFLVAIASYFILKNKDSIKDIPNEIKTTNEASNPKEQNSPTEYSVKNPNEEQKYEEYSKELDKVFTDKAETEDFINKENELIQKKVEEIKENNKNKSTKETSPAQNKKEKVNDKNIITSKDTFTYDKKNKPKIAIVVDDVSTQAQKEKILSMGYKINMAFLPPTSGHPDSARIAQNLPFHMIHFPMQASPSFKGAEVHTLNVGDSYETIENRVRQLREWFPNAIYTNNHTGSAFTENEEAACIGKCII